MKKLTRLVLPLVGVLALLPNLISHAQRALTVQPAASQEQRVALIIGNGAYAQGALTNPVNDARDIAAALRSTGFEVLFGANQNRKQMRELIRQFGDKIRNGGVGLFYFAGHGVQVNTTNYLIPISAEITKETEVEEESVSVNFVLAQMEDARNKLNIVILDACRDNPFARSFRTASERGLAVTKSAPTGTLVAYATAAGSVASDGAGRNGLFTQELLANLKTPGLTLESVFRRTRTTVRSKSKGQQVPYEYTSVEGDDFYFFPPTGASPPVSTSAPLVSTVPLATKPAVRMSVAGVPLFAMDFVTASVDASGNVKNQYQTQCEGFVEDLGNRVKLPMVEIPGGTFEMGSTNSATEEAYDEMKRYGKPGVHYLFTTYEEPQHQVRVRGFAMGRYEVTQAQWQAVMGGLPPEMRTLDGKFKGDELPVVRVSWDEVEEFCERLSKKTGHKYRLPTEAEWEYAARGGKEGQAFGIGDGNNLSSSQANFDGNYPYGNGAKGKYLKKTTMVGNYQANAYGLYDMSGNVWEWCSDWYGAYSSSAQTDPSGATSDSFRVNRGGGWGNDPRRSFDDAAARPVRHSPETRVLHGRGTGKNRAAQRACARDRHLR